MNATPTNDMTREQWLEERKSGIGSSDAPVITRMSPWKTPLELYLEKTGAVEDQDLTDNEAVHFGIIMEQVVADEFTRRTGLKVRRDNKMRRHQDLDWMLADLDRTVVRPGQSPAILECKTASAYKMGEWGDGPQDIPEHYLIQVQHQMFVAGYDMAFVAVLIGGQRFKHYEIPADQGIQDDLVALESDFWTKNIMPRVAPEPDYQHPSTIDLMKRLYPGTNGMAIHLPEDIFKAHVRLDQIKETAKALDKEIKALKGRIMHSLGESSAGLFPDGSGYTRRQVEPKEVSFTRNAYVDMRFTKKVKGV